MRVAAQEYGCRQEKETPPTGGRQRLCLQIDRAFSEANVGDTAGQEIHDIRANRKTFQNEQASSLSGFCRSMSLKLSERQKQRERNMCIPQSEALVLMGIG